MLKKSSHFSGGSMVGREGKEGREVERRKRGTDHTLQVRKKERWREGREEESREQVLCGSGKRRDEGGQRGTDYSLQALKVRMGEGSWKGGEEQIILYRLGRRR